ncbi:MAG: insulinase family protein [Candidatus Omnitrophica bacterium]|nr:insulinase family protein [Candidatus Omnitrophota bacterium]
MYAQSVLPNGLKVITIRMPDRASVSCAVWVRAGARFESQKISGIFHFLEHMLFKGTKKRNARQIKEEVEGVGGILNAFTSEECTCYFAKILKAYLPNALDVLADMVNHAALPMEEFKKEKTVILEEIKMYRDLPNHHVHDLMGELLWPDQPLGRPIAGTIESVSKLSRKEMMRYKQKYYHPQDMVVSVAGPVHHNSIVDQCRHLFPVVDKRPKSLFEKSNSRQRSPRTLFVEKPTEQTHFVIGMHGLSRLHPDRYKLGLLNVILGANMSSRLFEEIREKRGLAYDVKSNVNFFEDTGSFIISAGVEVKRVRTAIRLILKELAKFRKHFVRPGELRRAKDYFMSQLAMTMEDTLDHLLWTCERSVYREELPDRDKIRESVEAVTVSDIQSVAKNLFKTANLNLSLIGPIPSKIQNRIKGDFEIEGT